MYITPKVEVLEDRLTPSAVNVNSVYLELLGHPVDQAGLSYWQGRLDAGLTEVQLKAQIAGSAEFYNHVGGNNWYFLNALYQKELGRNLDEDGRTYWGTQLSQGASGASVALGVLSSPEYTAHQTLLSTLAPPPSLVQSFPPYLEYMPVPDILSQLPDNMKTPPANFGDLS